MKTKGKKMIQRSHGFSAPISIRSDEDNDLIYRSLAVRAAADGQPSTLDENNRSVEVVAATEEPVEVYDYDRYEIVKEILLMSGCEIPGIRQVPLFDSHRRYSAASVLGSLREMKTAKSELRGRVFFSTIPEAETPYTNVREGHQTDFSVGYRVHEAVWVPEGETATIRGRKYKGPVKVAVRWTPRELSVVPIGADEAAKARSDVSEHKNHQSTKPSKEEREMDKKLRELLENRGLSKDATDEEAWAFLDKLTLPDDDGKRLAPKKPVEDDETRSAGDDEARKADEAAERAAQKVLKEERGRVREIRSMCARFDCSELGDTLIADGTSIEEAREKVMEADLEKRQETAEKAKFLGTFEMVADERDKFRSAAVDSLGLRTGRIIEKPAPGALEIRGFTLVELARECLRVAGLRHTGDKREMVGRAMVAGDFSYILADSARKALFSGYETAEESWRKWCGIGQVSDFKTHNLVRASEMDDLDEIPEHTEYKYGERTEAREQYYIVTYGKLFAITRQTIINDDLSALNDVPMAHGEAVSRKLGDVAYAVLTANAAMGDGTALFHADHSNLGTGGVPSETTIAEAIKLMKLQKDVADKRRLNIRPRFFLAPVALEGSSEVFFNSMQFAGDNKAATRNNPYAGSYFERVYDGRLDDDSATAYYLAGPKGKTVTVFFLDGNQEPFLETKEGWTVDGVEYKVRIDAGAKAVDWRALIKNAGA